MVVEVGVDTRRTVVGGNLLAVVGNLEGDIVLEVVHCMELPEEDIRFDYIVEVEEDIPVGQEGIVVHKGVVHPEDRNPDTPEEEVLHIVLLVEVDILEEASMTSIAQMLMKTNFENRLSLKRVSRKGGGGGRALSLKGRTLISSEAVHSFNKIFRCGNRIWWRFTRVTLIHWEKPEKNGAVPF